MIETSDSLREQFGDIDVYLFDQLLRGRIVSGKKVLDAGCGSGRNLIFLMRAGFDVWGVHGGFSESGLPAERFGKVRRPTRLNPSGVTKKKTSGRSSR